MPRTGGVYTPPAGSKGTPNTTIQSAPYNTLIDDLAADANAPRPVTAGGTGATSASGARAALGVEVGTNVQAYDPGLQSIAGLTTVANQMLYTTGTDLYATTALTQFARNLLDDADAATMRATMGADNADNLTSGTINDARLPSTMSAKTFNTSLQISSSGTTIAIQRNNPNAVDIEAFLTSNNAVKHSIDLNRYGGAVTINGNTAWHAGNDGPLSGLDADTVDGQHGAYYQNATNLNTGTVADARLPTTMAGKTFSSVVSISAGGLNSIGATLLNSNGTSLSIQRNNPNAVDIEAFLTGTPGTKHSIDLNRYGGAVTINGNTAWHAGNGGTGSGLDADTVDGVHLSGLVQTSRTVTAGNGMTGGGALSANVTVALGTPTTLTGSTANAVTATSHTHAVTLTEADINTFLGFTVGKRVYGTGDVGSYGLLRRISANPANPTNTVAGSDLQWADTDGNVFGTVGIGTWLCMGYISGSTGARVTAWHRIA